MKDLEDLEDPKDRASLESFSPSRYLRISRPSTLRGELVVKGTRPRSVDVVGLRAAVHVQAEGRREAERGNGL